MWTKLEKVICHIICMPTNSSKMHKMCTIFIMQLAAKIVERDADAKRIHKHARFPKIACNKIKNEIISFKILIPYPLSFVY